MRRPLGIALMVLVATACQPRSGGGGGATPPPAQGGYNPYSQPAPNRLAGPGPAANAGRVPQQTGGPNAGAQAPVPPEDYRGAGSAYSRTIPVPSASPSVLVPKKRP